MKTWFGSYFTSSQAEPVEATVLAYEKNIAIGFRRADDGSNSTVTWDLRDIDVAFDNSLQATKISNLNEQGAKLIINGKDAKHFIEQVKAEHDKPWHKKTEQKNGGDTCLFSWEFLLF